MAADPAAVAEVRALGRELAECYGSLVAYYRSEMGCSPEEARKHVDTAPEAYLEQARRADPRSVTWNQLGALTGQDAADGQARWSEIKQAAREEVQSGFLAGRTIEGWNGTPYGRAVYLAVRDAMAEEWQPRGGLEWQLLETAAQAQAEWRAWLEDAAHLRQCENHKLARQYEKWEEPRISRAEATSRAIEMADRWNRIFLRNLRALRDLRRYASAVHIENHGQVNIGEKQINVGGE